MRHQERRELNVPFCLSRREHNSLNVFYISNTRVLESVEMISIPAFQRV